MDEQKFIWNKASNKLRLLGVQLRGNETIEELEELLRLNMTEREYDDFYWDLQIALLDLNASPC